MNGPSIAELFFCKQQRLNYRSGAINKPDEGETRVSSDIFLDFITFGVPSHDDVSTHQFPRGRRRLAEPATICRTLQASLTVTEFMSVKSRHASSAKMHGSKMAQGPETNL
jgi:hypothetical protein